MIYLKKSFYYIMIIFSLIKEANKYQLKIEFTVFRRKEYLIFDLDEYQKNILNKEDLINTIT